MYLFLESSKEKSIPFLGVKIISPDSDSHATLIERRGQPLQAASSRSKSLD